MVRFIRFATNPANLQNLINLINLINLQNSANLMNFPNLTNLMNPLTTSQRFFMDLFALDGPFPGHGVRVSPPGVNDQAVLRQDSIEDRAQMGKRAFEFEQRCLEEIGDDRVPMLHCWTGTEVFAAAFGSPVSYPTHSMPFALPAVYTAEDADRLQEPDLSSGTLGDMFRLADRMVELCGPQHPVRICDIQSPFDISALIWEKEAFFNALIDSPEAVHRLLRKVTNTLIRFIRAFRDRYANACLVHYPDVWMPAEWGVCLSEDDIGSISNRHFETFCLPYLQDLAREFGGISMHSCAAGQHQWQSCLKLPRMRYMNLHHPPTSLQVSIDTFSDRAVLIPSTSFGVPYDLDFIRDCLRRAKPNTRFFFMLGAEDMSQARELAAQIKQLCGRSS